VTQLEKKKERETEACKLRRGFTECRRFSEGRSIALGFYLPVIGSYSSSAIPRRVAETRGKSASLQTPDKLCTSKCVIQFAVSLSCFVRSTKSQARVSIITRDLEHSGALTARLQTLEADFTMPSRCRHDGGRRGSASRATSSARGNSFPWRLEARSRSLSRASPAFVRSVAASSSSNKRRANEDVPVRRGRALSDSLTINMKYSHERTLATCLISVQKYCRIERAHRLSFSFVISRSLSLSLSFSSDPLRRTRVSSGARGRKENRQRGSLDVLPILLSIDRSLSLERSLLSACVRVRFSNGQTGVPATFPQPAA